MPIMPVFLKYPGEAAIIGRLLAGYGELEFCLAECVSDHVHNNDAAFRLMFRTRLGETEKIRAADSLIRRPLAELGLATEYADAHGAIGWCVKVRNQYAHCHWTEQHKGGLAFAKLRDRYENATTKPVVEIPVDMTLLTAQEDYFCYTRDCLTFLHEETLLRIGRSKRHPFAMPSKRRQPLLHKPLTSPTPPGHP
jgi:hypothetical protein